MDLNDFDFTPDFYWMDGRGDGKPYHAPTAVAFVMAIIAVATVGSRLLAGPWVSFWWDLPGAAAGLVGVGAALYGLARYGEGEKTGNIILAAICNALTLANLALALYVALY